MSEEKIIESAIAEFAEYGFDGTRIDRIARRAKVNKAMIYYHFKGKEKLYEKVIRDIAQGIREHIGVNMKKEISSIEDILEIFSIFVEYLHSIDIDFFRIVMREISSGGKYFKKIFLPNTLIPFLELFVNAIEILKKKRQIADVNPMYTFFLLVGSALYFNLLRIVLKDTELYKTVFHENYIDEYMKNISAIVMHGLKYGKEVKAR